MGDAVLIVVLAIAYLTLLESHIGDFLRGLRPDPKAEVSDALTGLSLEVGAR